MHTHVPAENHTPSTPLPVPALLPQVGICMGTAALLGRALWGTAAALTTNEMILRRRYAYLQDTQGLYRCEGPRGGLMGLGGCLRTPG